MRSLCLLIGMLCCNFYAFAGDEEWMADEEAFEKAAIIDVDGTILTGKQFKEEYITTAIYIPEANKFKVHKCNQEKLRDKEDLAEKRHHRHNHYSRSTRANPPPIQWLQCKECGMILRGWTIGRQHYKETGHFNFQRVNFP